ncbi:MULTISPECIES: DUF4430 domain-containing protein [unclassified Granulicatella]|uniref:DUF4430 domain-containing protein n=1 Tax=unclassified Granulicatella TaxID=2630493 RepID=UPI0010735F21|nr:MULTISPECIES: DUF4430 domain-containing protein [unclassified Granulicatella]MBF0780910.1 DUF4430 domain-containing protein [Granulicatella sp. 19428wC4_WM01]TFU93225.1 DUF4430 domain-containing protein [Granulicatella sp. WM01]
MKKLLKTKKGKVILASLYIGIVAIGCLLIALWNQNQEKDQVAYQTKMSQSVEQASQTSEYQSNSSDASHVEQSNQEYSSIQEIEQSGEQSTRIVTEIVEERKVSTALPKPVEPENVVVNKEKVYRATFTIRVDTILNNMDKLDPDKVSLVPENGVLLAVTEVEFSENENVFSVLQRLTRQLGIHMDSTFTPIYNSAYVKGIGNLYEFDCGPESGWMYRVNGVFPNYGASRYVLKNGDVVEWLYTCQGLGKDISR